MKLFALLSAGALAAGAAVAAVPADAQHYGGGYHSAHEGRTAITGTGRAGAEAIAITSAAACFRAAITPSAAATEPIERTTEELGS